MTNIDIAVTREEKANTITFIYPKKPESFTLKAICIYN